MFCGNCGVGASETARFCTSCGNALSPSPAIAGGTQGDYIEARVIEANTARPPQPPPQAQPQTINVTQQVQLASPMIFVQRKNVSLAIILAFFFGPLGLFYASVSGGLVMLLITLLVAIPTMGVGLLFTVPACMIWAGVAANNYNLAIIAASSPPVQINRS